MFFMEKNLHNKDNSIAFYEERYTNGYMDDWPADKKQRVFNLIKSLSLPKQGKVVEFGCGNGVFTEVIRQSLPNWIVYGTDISNVAIETAKSRYPYCHFFVAGDPNYNQEQFDFLLTHHVLEHVYDLNTIATEMADMMKANASMLHILPCGNQGSLEYNICLMRSDGTECDVGNRFFFEDRSHLRRLTTEQLLGQLSFYGFFLNSGWYSNQYYGALKWITEYPKEFIMQLTDTTKATSNVNVFKLIWLRKKLLLIKKARNITEKKDRRRSFRDVPLTEKFDFLRSLVKIEVAGYLTSYYLNRAEKEWKTCSLKPNGSEMYLLFTKQ